MAAFSVVSKSYRSLVASPELYELRSLTGCTETYDYVCIGTPPYPYHPRWYILGDKKLIPIPCLPSQTCEGSSVVAMDWGFYVIGGSTYGSPTSEVWFLDCRNHTWCKVPSMGVARAYSATGVVDGKIYVVGGCKDDVLNWGEVFDPRTQTWGYLPSMELNHVKIIGKITTSVVKDGRVCAVDEHGRTLYYSPSECKWGEGNDIDQTMRDERNLCMIDNLIYYIDSYMTISWCKPEESVGNNYRKYDWKEVKGLEMITTMLNRSRVVHFPKHFQNKASNAKIIKSVGNMVVFWDHIGMEKGSLQIWCAEISLERRQGQRGSNIWDNIEWCHPVMTTSYAPHFVGRSTLLYNVSVTL